MHMLVKGLKLTFLGDAWFFDAIPASNLPFLVVPARKDNINEQFISHSMLVKQINLC